MSSRKYQTGEILLLHRKFFLLFNGQNFIIILLNYIQNIVHLYNEKSLISSIGKRNLLKPNGETIYYSHRDCFSGIIDMVLADNRMVF